MKGEVVCGLVVVGWSEMNGWLNFSCSYDHLYI